MPVFDRRENAVSMPLSTRFPYSLCRTRPSQSEVISHVSKMQLNNLSHHEPVEDNATILSLQAATNTKHNSHQTFDFMLVSLFLNFFLFRSLYWNFFNNKTTNLPVQKNKLLLSTNQLCLYLLSLYTKSNQTPTNINQSQNTKNITEDILINEAYWVRTTREVLKISQTNNWGFVAKYISFLIRKPVF